MSTHERPVEGLADPVIDRLVGLRGSAYGLAARFLSGREGAEDIVQQAYVAAFEHLRSGPPPRDERAWFLTVVANAARTHLRVEAARARREAVVQGQRAPGRETDAELGHLLNKSMNALAEKYRIPLALCYEQGLSHGEAAVVLDIPKRTLTRHVSEGLEELRRTLAKAGYAAAPAAIIGGLAHTAPAAPAALAAMVGKALAGGLTVKGPGLGAGAAAAAKGGIAVKVIAGVVAAGALAGGLAVAPRLLGGGQPNPPPAAETKAADIVPPKIVITPDQVKEFFGGKPAKMLLSVQYGSKPLPGQERPASIYRHFLLDFSVQPFTPVMVVDGVFPDGYGDDEAFISPDGTRLVYQDADGIYVCEFKPGGPGRKKIASETAGHTPRWWIHPRTGDEYIIYIRPEPKIQGCGFGKGKTLLQQIKKGTCEPEGAEKILVKDRTFNGGRSLDGKYICASHFGWAIAELKPDAVEDAFVKLLKTGQNDRCNPSISQDPKHPEWWLWCDPSHCWMYYNPHLEEPKWGGVSQTESEKAMREKEAIPQPPKTGRLDHAEWSTHPDYITVTNPTGTWWITTYIWSWPLKKWVEVSQRGIGAKTPKEQCGSRMPTHLWVGK